MLQRHTALVTCLLGLSACTGEIGTLAQAKEEVASNAFACREAEDPSATPVLKLSTVQYRNTLTDLLSAAGVAPVLELAASKLAGIPKDGDGNSFSRMDPRVSAQHIDGYFAVARVVASAVVDDPQHLRAIAGECVTAPALSSQCLEAFLARFGRLAYRRPLLESEAQRFRELNAPGEAPKEVIRDVLLSLLVSPPFLYHLELEGEPIAGREDLLQLKGYAVASRLSYHFWQSMPDAALLDKAASGALDTEQGYREEVERLVNHPRTQEVLRGFYAEWFRLDVFSGFADTAAFNAFEEGLDVHAPQKDYRTAMVDEVQALADYYTWRTPGTFSQMLTSDLSVSRSADLARLYGAEPWSGVGEPPKLPAGQRSGLLTRAAFLTTGDEHTSPFHRGAYIRRAILCDSLSSPDPSKLPPGALTPPVVDGSTTTRQRFAQKTASAECQVCHGQFSDIGFALESYDSLGRYRTQERVYDDSGRKLAELPVDVSAVPKIHFDDERPLNGPVALSERIAESGKADACFARHYFRFTYRRKETPADGCVLEGLRTSLAGSSGASGSIRVALREIALQPQFRQRKVSAQ